MQQLQHQDLDYCAAGHWTEQLMESKQHLHDAAPAAVISGKFRRIMPVVLEQDDCLFND